MYSKYIYKYKYINNIYNYFIYIYNEIYELYTLL